MAAYRIGTRLLGESPSEAVAVSIEVKVEAAEPLEPGWWQRFSGVAKPIALGAAVLATAAALTTYAATSVFWRLWLLVRLRRRRRARA